jgi:hypothetical protein
LIGGFRDEEEESRPVVKIQILYDNSNGEQFLALKSAIEREFRSKYKSIEINF